MNNISFIKFKLTVFFLAVLSLPLFAAARIELTGRVQDATGELMIGVTILEKGTGNGTVTDLNGTYSIVLTTENPVLVVSYIGYETQEIKVSSGKTLLDITMKENISELDEVQVVGYGTQRKISVVGAQSTLKMSQIKAPVANLSSIIAGRLSGVVAVQRTAEPGHDNSDIWIRGIATLRNHSSKPLVLVDGVERDFEQLDPEDIESVSILKDASATAVYGVRGGNGVLIITTKPGIVSEPKFSVDYYEGFSRLTKRPAMANAYQYMAAANEASIHSSGTARYSDDYINATKKAYGVIPNDNPQMFNPYLYPNVDWMDEMFNDMGNNRRVNLNLRGGAPKATYYASLSYYDETGLTKSDPSQAYNSDITYNRYNFLTNINLKVLEKTTLDVGVNGYFATGNYPEISTSSLFNKSMTVSPVMMPKLYPDGSIPGVNKENEEMSNPYAELTRRGYKDEYNTQVNSNIKLLQNLDFWSWSKGLKAHVMIAFDVKDDQKLHYKIRESSWKPNGTKSDTGLWNEDVYDDNGILKLVEEYQGNNTLSYEMKANAGDGENDRDVRSWRTFYAETAINYDRIFNGVHNVTGLFLFNMKDYRNPNTNTLFNSLPYKDMGFSGRATYSYNDRYFAEVNLGYTGSQNFSPERRFGFFPAFAFGWVPSNESFWQPVSPYISFLKLRYSDGYVGSDSLGGDRFGFTTEMEDTDHGYSFGGKSEGGVQVKRYGALVMWSRIHARNLGLDINFWDDKLNFVFDAFKEKRDKIYTERKSIPDYAGFSSLPNGNVGVVENRGVEASFEYNQSIGSDWFISLRGNFTYNEDEIIDNDEPEPAYPWLSVKGTNVMARMGYIAEGLFTSEEEIVERNIRQFGENYPGAITRPGDIKYKDLNGDNVIDANDKTKIGHGDIPKYYYGFGGDFRYKNVGLGILFQGTAGADRHLQGRSIHPFQGDGGLGNLFANIDDRWSPDDPDNQNVFYPRLAWGGGDAGNVNNFETSTWWQRDMSFLRLKQFTVSYYLPQKWMDKTFLERGRLYAMGSNVFTWSKFKLWDPELNTDNGSSYPNTTTFSIGVNFSF